MKVILLKELPGRGGEGDVIDVAHGFAVNYLLPQGIAVEATPGELKQLEQRRHNIEKRELARTTDAQALKEALDGKSLSVEAKVGEEGQLFGSVTAAMLSEAIAEQIGAQIDRKKIETGGPIKTVGEHEVTVAVYRDIKATLTVTVTGEGGVIPEAAGQTAEGAAGAEGAEGAEGAVAADGEAPATEPADAETPAAEPTAAEVAAPTDGESAEAEAAEAAE